MATKSSYTSGTDGANYICPHCAGSGTVTDAQGNTTKCLICYGAGTVTYKAQQKYLNSKPLPQPSTQIKFVDCPECGASKQIMDDVSGKLVDCPTCKATGYVDEETKKKWLEDNEGK